MTVNEWFWWMQEEKLEVVLTMVTLRCEREREERRV